MFEFLQEKITKLFDKLSKRGTLSERDIDDALREIRIALFEADVHYRVVKELLDNVRQQALAGGLSRSIDPSKYLLRLLKEELIGIMGPAAQLKTVGTGDIIMLVGLQGAGKTTTTVKLAKYLKEKKGLKPYLVSIDFNRPAAQEQLRILAKANGFPVHEGVTGTRDRDLQDVRLASARNGCDFIIVDTAGRMHIDEALMEELQFVRDTLQPSSTLLVVDAMTGHDVLKMAEGFMTGVGYDGAIFTKFEGDARGGAALSFRKIIDKPVFFTGTGESVSALEPFVPDKLVSRIIGSGDMEGLVEKVSEAITADDMHSAQDLGKGKFTFPDFIKQLKMMKRLGSIDSLLGMVPGMNKLKGSVSTDTVKRDLKVYEAIIGSMTNQERNNPEVLNGKRKQRIARGSGTRVEDVNRLIKRFRESQRMIDIMHKGGIKGIQRLLH